MPINDAETYRAYLASIRTGDTVTMAMWTPKGMAPQQGLVTSAEDKPQSRIYVDARTFSRQDGHTPSTRSYLQAPGFDIGWQAPFAHEDKDDA